MTTPAEICKFQGTAGYAQCWSCPVRDCPLWQDPGAALSDDSQRVALAAVTRITSGRTGIPKRMADDKAGLALEMLYELTQADTQTALRVRQAAEAVIQGLYLPGRRAAEDKVYNKYIGRCMARPDHLAGPDDEAWLDGALLMAVSDIAANEYNAPKQEVADEVAYMRNLKLRSPREWEADV